MLRRRTLLILFSALLYSALPAAAQDPNSPSARPVTVDGLLDGSSREFQSSELRDGTIYLSFAVMEFDSVQNAENGIDPFVDATLEYLNANGFTWSSFPTVAPSVRESTLAYEGKTVVEGHTLDTAILVFRDGRYLHTWIAWGRGFAPNPLLDLAAIAEQFYRDIPPFYETAKAARPLDLLPALNDLPPGFAMSKETDDLATEWLGASGI